MSDYLLISDAAKEVKVESHVLRYWEEELHLPIKRNELGHRYYTREDVERFKQIKSMKERGLQLKAIKVILRDGRLDVLPQEKENVNGHADYKRTEENENGHADYRKTEENETGKEETESRRTVKESRWENESNNGEHVMAIDIVNCRPGDSSVSSESREDKAKRLQWLLQQMIRETLRENNQELSREIKESIVKELDYQFRSQEEREEEREQRRERRDEDYYRRMDELLRKKSKRTFMRVSTKKKEKIKEISDKENRNQRDSKGMEKDEPQYHVVGTGEKRIKKKRHSF